jgi:hypothetical protein
MIRALAVVVPAANEEAELPGCLAALTAARAMLARERPDIAVRIVVTLDRCTDRSELIARAVDGVETGAVSHGRVGAARAAGVASVLAGGAADRTLWLANTDADSLVPRDWLTGMVAAADAGADVVLGTVLPGPGLPRAARRRWYREHHLAEGHRHVHGANFGIRAETYLRLGGWPDLATGEDDELASRAAACRGVQVHRTAALPVITSTRLTGRAPRGFSSYLRGLSAARAPAPR